MLALVYFYNVVSLFCTLHKEIEINVLADTKFNLILRDKYDNKKNTIHLQIC